MSTGAVGPGDVYGVSIRRSGDKSRRRVIGPPPSSFTDPDVVVRRSLQPKPEQLGQVSWRRSGVTKKLNNTKRSITRMDNFVDEPLHSVSTPPVAPKEDSFLWRHSVAIIAVALLAGFVTYAGIKLDAFSRPDVLVAYSLGTLILGGGACYLFKKEKAEGQEEPLTRMQKAGRILLALLVIGAVGAIVGTVTYFANNDLFWNVVHKVEPIVEGAFVTDAWKMILTGVAIGAIPVAILASAVHHRKEETKKPEPPSPPVSTRSSVIDHSADGGWGPAEL